MNATIRHYCEPCGQVFRADEVTSIPGRRYARDFRGDFTLAPSITMLPVFTAGDTIEAVPGQTTPSGACPKCDGPVFCADFHPC